MLQRPKAAAALRSPKWPLRRFRVRRPAHLEDASALQRPKAAAALRSPEWLRCSGEAAAAQRCDRLGWITTTHFYGFGAGKGICIPSGP